MLVRPIVNDSFYRYNYFSDAFLDQSKIHISVRKSSSINKKIENDSALKFLFQSL